MRQLLVFAASAALTLSAATIGPDSFGYTATDNSSQVNYASIAGSGTVVLNGTDDSAVQVALGFTFNFYGVDYTQIFLSTNGLMTFGGGNATFTNQNLSTTDQLRPSIAPLWNDWVTNQNSSDEVYYQTDGAPGSRIFKAQWDQVEHFSNSFGGNVTFAAWLFEGTNKIVFFYPDIDLNTDGLTDGKSATVGIADANGAANGRNLQWSFNQSIDGTRVIEFTPGDGGAVPEPSTYALLGAGLAALVALRKRA